MAHIVVRGLKLLVRDPRALARGTYRRSYRLLTDIPGDIALGISTGIWKNNRGDEAQQNYGYEPVPYPTLLAIRRHIRRNRINAGEFFDIGCGYGRPLYFFSRQFKTLIGYEIDRGVLESASRQLSSAQARVPRYANIRIVDADATTALPAGGDIVVFLYNPFGPDPMQEFCAMLKRRQGLTHVYYANPVHADIVECELGQSGEEFSSFMKVRYYRLGRDIASSSNTRLETRADTSSR